MSKLISAAAAAFLFTAASARADEQVWEMNSLAGRHRPHPLQRMEQSRRRDLGPARRGEARLGDSREVGVKGDAAAHKLDRECGAKKVDAPSFQGRDAARIIPPQLPAPHGHDAARLSRTVRFLIALLLELGRLPPGARLK